MDEWEREYLNNWNSVSIPCRIAIKHKNWGDVYILYTYLPEDTKVEDLSIDFKKEDDKPIITHIIYEEPEYWICEYCKRENLLEHDNCLDCRRGKMK